MDFWLSLTSQNFRIDKFLRTLERSAVVAMPRLVQGRAGKTPTIYWSLNSHITRKSCFSKVNKDDHMIQFKKIFVVRYRSHKIKHFYHVTCNL